MSQAQANDPAVFGHYSEDYFAWQQESGKFGGWANLSKYRDHVQPDMRVLDFGCGGGFLLSQLDCKERFGIEPNPAARATAQANGLTMFESPGEALAALGDGNLDMIISDNALEHTLEPWRVLQAILPLLKPGGQLRMIVPCEGIWWTYKRDNIDQHMYSWSPQSIGNLAAAAGFEVIAAKPYVHKWPPRAETIAKLGRPVFDAVARLWGHIDRRWFQLELIAKRPL